MLKRKRAQRGFSLVEVVLGMAILAIVMLAVTRGFIFTNQRSVETDEKAFASQKCIQMMEELRGLVTNNNINMLDNYDDGSSYNPILSTKQEVTSPGDLVSGNANLRYVRQVSVIHMPNDPLCRQVMVRVYKKDTMEGIAETISVIRSVATQYVPSQVFDIYILSLENVPGWWDALSNMIPVFNNVVQDLQTRNPGLEWRTHFITRLSYGRDPYYAPYLNETVGTDAAGYAPMVYLYPGLMQKPSVGNFFYYVPSYLQSQYNLEGTIVSSTSYALADQYNHAARYPDEIVEYNEAVAAAAANSQPKPEISLRMLLEQMNTSTSGLDNLLIMNLHGELLPMPPMRDYSDAAKDPVAFTNVRFVTHPENLSNASGSQVKLRAYSYVTNPGSWATNASLSTATIQIMGTNIVPVTNVSIRKLVGNDVTPYAWQDAILGVDYAINNTTSTSVVINLYNSPLRCPANGNTGLSGGNRLWGYEYIPSLVTGAGAFAEGARDLTWNSNQPKNTARWVITIATGTLADGQYQVQAWIGDNSYYMSQQCNFESTYIWIGQTPPVTEQFQFQGDPRDMPYADVAVQGRYNPYFVSVNTGDYPMFTGTANGWGGYLPIDVPRFFQVFRTGLLTMHGLWTTMTGFSFYYVGLGGEMGYDSSNGFPNGLPILETPWNSGGSSVVGVDEITSAQTQPYPRLISNTANTWFCKPWLGELYPDSAFATWVSSGNLPIGAGNYYRVRYSNVGFAYDPVKRTNQIGCSSFFNGNSTGGNTVYYNHDYADTNTGNLTAAGSQVSQDLNFPLLATINAKRPFRLDYSDPGRRPPEWNSASYNTQRTLMSTVENYYDAQNASFNSSSLVRFSQGGNVANAVINGLSPQANFGTSEIEKLVSINLIRGFMSLGGPSITTSRIPQLPLVYLSSPTVTDQFVNPSSIYVVWTSSWTRWDGQLYTSAYASGFSEATPLTWNVKYSPDRGKTWFFVQDGAAAILGTKDLTAPHPATAPVTWDVSALPRGNYLLRVEGFRTNINLHYTYIEREIYIQR